MLEFQNVSYIYGAGTPFKKVAIDNVSLTIPDGIGVVYAAKILKTPLKERVPGVELAEKIIEYQNDKP